MLNPDIRNLPAVRPALLKRGGPGFVLWLAASAAAAQSAVTLYGGASGGGEFDSANDPQTTFSAANGAALAASVDWRLADGRQGQVYYAYQRSALPGAAFGQPGDVGIDISYLHLGGRIFFDGTASAGGAYVVGGLGVTVFSPGLSGLSTEVRPSMNLGVGYQWPLTPNIALRTELRSLVSLINSSGGFFCSGGCTVSIRGDAFVQFQGLIGLSVGF